MLSEVKAAFQGGVVETPIVDFNECAYISFALRLLHGQGSYGQRDRARCVFTILRLGYKSFYRALPRGCGLMKLNRDARTIRGTVAAGSAMDRIRTRILCAPGEAR